jgi:ribosomal protein S17
VLFLAGTVSAHPPKEVKIEFDPDAKMMTVIAYHDTKDPSKHYLRVLEVELNGDKMIEQKFKSQPDAETQKAHYWLNDAKIGDTITVIATCSIAGKKTTVLKIEKKAEGQSHKMGHYPLPGGERGP